MADFRSSQIIVGVLADWDPQLRIAQHYVEAALDTDPQLRVAQHYVEVASDDDPALRVTQYHLEVLYLATEPEEEESVEFSTMYDPMFPVYVPVEYGERWGHSS